MKISLNYSYIVQVSMSYYSYAGTVYYNPMKVSYVEFCNISIWACCWWAIQVFQVDYVYGYRNWPRYGLRWSGLCCHSRHSTSGAGRGSTNHSSADRMSGQFLFYYENEAIHNDKSCDDHDDEPPCWNALAGNTIVMMKASIDTVSEQ